MPLTAKGEDILSAMEREYGESKGKSVFFASKAAGKITGTDEQTQEPMAGLGAAFDALTMSRVASACDAYDARHR